MKPARFFKKTFSLWHCISLACIHATKVNKNKLRISLLFVILLFLVIPHFYSSLVASEIVLLDDFNDNTTNSFLWTQAVLGTGPTVSEVNQVVEINIPSNSADDPIVGIFRAGYFNNCRLKGDFDMQIDFNLPLWPEANGIRVGLVTLDSQLTTETEAMTRISFGAPNDSPGSPREVYLTKLGNTFFEKIATSDISGKLRLERIGNVISGYYFDDISNIWVKLDDRSSSSEEETAFGIFAWNRNIYFTNQDVVVTFDNFVVNQGELICPFRLNVSHFSQKDPEWKDEEYDYSSEHNPVGLQEIEDWGCAMSSSAMILKYHGFDKGPQGQDTDPENLNQYLIDNNGYTNHGGVIWSYITKYARDARNNDHVPDGLKLLEFSYPSYDLDTLKEDIEDENPSIVKIVMDDKGTPKKSDDNLHFVTATGYMNDMVSINDPWDLVDTVATLNSSYAGKTYRKLARFIPSDTDLSYIWIYVYSPTANLLVEYNGNETGVDGDGVAFFDIPGAEYFEEGTISDPTQVDRFGGSASSAKVFMLPKPDSGEYTLTFAGDSEELTSFSMRAFDEDSGVFVYDSYSYLHPSTQTVYTLDFDKEDSEEETIFTRDVNFETFKSDIRNMKDLGLIDGKTYDNLLRHVELAERFYSRNQRASMVLLNVVERYLNIFHPKRIEDQAHEFLLQELEFLKASIL